MVDIPKFKYCNGFKKRGGYTQAEDLAGFLRYRFSIVAEQSSDED